MLLIRRQGLRHVVHHAMPQLGIWTDDNRFFNRFIEDEKPEKKKKKTSFRSFEVFFHLQFWKQTHFKSLHNSNSMWSSGMGRQGTSFSTWQGPMLMAPKIWGTVLLWMFLTRVPKIDGLMDIPWICQLRCDDHVGSRPCNFQQDQFPGVPRTTIPWNMFLALSKFSEHVAPKIKHLSLSF